MTMQPPEKRSPRMGGRGIVRRSVFQFRHRPLDVVLLHDLSSPGLEIDEASDADVVNRKFPLGRRDGRQPGHDSRRCLSKSLPPGALDAQDSSRAKDSEASEICPLLRKGAGLNEFPGRFLDSCRTV